MRRWAAGYGTHVKLLASAIGGRIAPPPTREAERAGLFDAVDFPSRYERALRDSTNAMEALAAYGRDGAFDASAQHALLAVLPEGTIDPPAEGPAVT
jgi:hypothetical protein